jgi:hypothetical protein
LVDDEEASVKNVNNVSARRLVDSRQPVLPTGKQRKVMALQPNVADLRFLAQIRHAEPSDHVVERLLHIDRLNPSCLHQGCPK